MTVPVTFYMDASDAEIASLRELQPDAEPHRLLRGNECWIAQTYARLRDAGDPVQLSNRVPDEGVVVFYAGDKRRLWAGLDRDNRALLVAVRSDRHPVGFADVEVVQNLSSADATRTLHVPHWPQPGLLPRDASRGTQVRVILYPGGAHNLHDGFSAAPWQRFLQQHGLEFRCHFAAEAGQCPDWHDYRDVDVMLAIRPTTMGIVRNKPAWKLFNAWLAGTPAILGAEFGYRELRRGRLDYLEAVDPGSAMRAVGQLLHEPGVYAAMVENGRARGAEYTVAATRARWQRLLFETLPQRYADPARQPTSLAGRRWRTLAYRLKRLLQERR